MLIEQIIEFQLRGPWAPGRTCSPITGQLHNKTKISKENRRVDIIINCLILQEAMLLTFSLHGPKHLQLKFYTLMQDFKCVSGFNY